MPPAARPVPAARPAPAVRPAPAAPGHRACARRRRSTAPSAPPAAGRSRDRRPAGRRRRRRCRCRARRRAHAAATRRKMPDRPTPTAPPSWRRKLIVLEPCGISSIGSERIAPRLSDGSTKPSPMRPTAAQAVITSSEVAGPTPTISANDSASSASPIAHQQVDRLAVGEAADDDDRHGQHEPGRQQHRADLRRRQLQRRSA